MECDQWIMLSKLSYRLPDLVQRYLPFKSPLWLPTSAPLAASQCLVVGVSAFVVAPVILLPSSALHIYRYRQNVTLGR